MKTGKVTIVVLAIAATVGALYFIYKYLTKEGEPTQTQPQAPPQTPQKEEYKEVDILEPPADTPKPKPNTPKPKPSQKPKCNDKDPNKVLVLKKGSKGKEVCALQNMLNFAAKQKGLTLLVADGAFGTKTQKLIKDLGYWSDSLTLAQAQSFLLSTYGVTPMY